jgi:hypothetical protein
MVGESSTHQRSGHRCYAVHCTNEAGVDGALLKWHGICNDDQSTTENAGRANACNCTTHDQSSGRRSSATQRRTNLKDEDGNQVNDLDGEKCVEFAEHKLERACREEICTPIPADVVNCFEVVGYARNGCRNDSVVLGLGLARQLVHGGECTDQRDQEDGKAEGDGYDDEFETVRVFRFRILLRFVESLGLLNRRRFLYLVFWL